jgi:hypothetical protein
LGGEPLSVVLFSPHISILFLDAVRDQFIQLVCTPLFFGVLFPFLPKLFCFGPQFFFFSKAAFSPSFFLQIGFMSI